MTKSTAAKGCICLGIVLLLAAGGILAWVFVGGDDTNSKSQSKNSDKGGLFGTGIFAGNTNGTTTGVSPTAAPSPRPTVYEYPFDQCRSSSSNNGTITCCNGLDNLCDWPVNEILFGAVHNAMATADKFLVPNHKKPVAEALERGFRGINLDVCNCQGVYTLCHGVCGLGQADPLALVGDIVTFLQENPNEVVLLTLELNSNAGQTVDLGDFDTTVLRQIEGFHDALYVHADVSAGDDDEDAGDLAAGGDREDPWPTLRKLIEDDKRLLVFHLNGPTCREGESSCPKGLHYYFEYFQETQFQFETVDELLDVESSCLVTRGAGASTGAFFAVNNFVTAQGAAAFLSESPPAVVAETVNAKDFASERIENCAAWIQEGPYRGEGDVNVMFVDYWSVGDMVEVVQEHNLGLGIYSERRQR